MTQTPPAQTPTPQEEAPKRRGFGAPGDMVRSMAVILGIVVVLLLIVPRPNKVPTRTLDVTSAARSASQRLGFAAADPTGLPDTWSARAAEVQRGEGGTPTWHLSYVTPTGHYAGVQQAARPPSGWEALQVTDGVENGTHEAGGKTWIVRSRLDRGITSWVLRTPATTTVVTGTAPESELDQLAAAVVASS